MAVEPKRRCGFRKVGGLYLVGEGSAAPCGKLPYRLTACPTCNAGFKPSRGWTWINGWNLFGDRVCVTPGFLCDTCPLSDPDQGIEMIEAGLIWIGEQFYPTPQSFEFECLKSGSTTPLLEISTRIGAVPRGFVIGQTWVFLAHPKQFFGIIPHDDKEPEADIGPAIFRVFRPSRIETLITESQAKDPELMKKLTARGLTAIVVPDNDPDHQGTVYDKAKEPELSFADVGAPNGQADSNDYPTIETTHKVDAAADPDETNAPGRTDGEGNNFI
jgi:hypothetical protein